MSHLYSREFRPLVRQLAINVWPGPVFAKRKLLVSGMPRSGTSWVAKLISLAEGVSYYFEPDNTLSRDYTFKYLGINDNAALLQTFMRDTFKGRVNSDYVIAEQGLVDILRHPLSHTVLAKVVHLPLALDWINHNFPDVVMVQVIRHPVPVFQSWKVRDWDPGYNLGLLLKQEPLMAGPLAPYRSVMQAADSYWTQAAALWSAIVKMQYLQHKDNFFMVEHEWLCFDPVPRVRSLIEGVGLEWNSNIENFLTKGGDGQVSGPGYGKWRNPSSEINKWKNKVSQSEMDEIWSVMACFDLPCYKNLEIIPEVSHCPGTPQLTRESV